MPEDINLVGLSGIGWLKDKLGVWLIVAMSAGAAGASPATDTSSSLTHFSDMAGTDADACALAMELSHEDKIRICEDAQRELRITLALLEDFREEAMSNEVDAYLGIIGPVLASPEEGEIDIDRIAFVAGALRDARRYLTENANSFGLWLRVMGIQDPDGAPYRVPAKFVKVSQPTPEEPLALTDSEIEFYRGMEEFLGDDANTESSFG